MDLPQSKVLYPVLGLEGSWWESVWKSWEDEREWEFGFLFFKKNNKMFIKFPAFFCDISYCSDFLEKAIKCMKPGYTV